MLIVTSRVNSLLNVWVGIIVTIRVSLLSALSILVSIWVMMSLLPLPAADHVSMSRVWELLSGTTAQNYVKITLRPHRLTLKCLIPQTDQILET